MLERVACNMMTGNQLKSGRALAGMSLGDLAQETNIPIGMLETMESYGPEFLGSETEDEVQKIQTVLDKRSVVFGTSGVRLRGMES